MQTLPHTNTKVALVTGATRGVGKGVAGAWGGYERMVEGGQFTWPAPFWQQPLSRWEAMVTVGVRGAFVASQHASRMMVPARQGLIVHISSWAAQKYIGNVLYGVAKAATDKLAADMAHELKPHGVTVVSMYPGLVRTEAVLSAGIFDLSNSESPEFIGRAVAALSDDPAALRRTGQVVVVAELAREYGLTDIDGKQPRPLTSQTCKQEARSEESLDAMRYDAQTDYRC